MKKWTNLSRLLAIAVILNSCYSYKWNTQSNEQLGAAPESIVSIFNSYPNGIMSITAKTPGYSYKYDVGEKDDYYDSTAAFKFDNVELELNDKMPPGMVTADIVFKDQVGNTVSLKEIDLMKLIPKLDAEGDMLYPEILEEEYNRFGLKFRKEHDEFNLNIKYGEGREQINKQAYRVGLTNNCLSPTKWEFNVTTEEYDDFAERCSGENNINQNRNLAHSWFYIDANLYRTLLELKNPGKDISMNFDMDYNELSNRAEQVDIDFDKLRNPIKNKVEIETLEIGHKSGRKVEQLDLEEFYKIEYGLLLNQKEFTYTSILEEEINITQFKNEGFYSAETPKTFDWGWMKHLDQIEMDVIDIKGSDAYVQIKLTGEWTPYEITLGNVDLSLIDEQKLFGFLFGINTYPKSRRYNPVQNTRSFDADLIPDEIKPYLFLTDKATGKWVNNQYKGVEKIYLTYDDVEGDVLNLYVLSYERIVPMWMGKVKLPKNLRETIRIRKKLYSN